MVTGFGDDDDGRPVLFYSFPTGEEALSQVGFRRSVDGSELKRRRK
jgi:hypothetical protein